MISNYQQKIPDIHETVFVAKSADIIGEVKLLDNASVFFNCTLRGDINFIHVGKDSNIQDNTVIHVADEYGVTIGDRVTVGHSCVIHACQIEEGCLIGMGSIIMDGAVIPSNSLVAAGSLVTEGATFPPNHLILGRPAKAVRLLKSQELSILKDRVKKYVNIKNQFKLGENND